jgi:hypothetical protein
MACSSCGLENQQQLRSEMVIHFPGSRNLNRPAVLAFLNLRFCVDCGAKKLVIPEAVLRRLGTDAAAPRPQTFLTQEMP